MRGVEMAVARGLRCKVVLMPDGEDIDSLLHASGPEAFEKLRESAPEGLDFCIRMLAGQSPREAVAWVKNFLRQVEQPELLPAYISKLARGLDLDEASLRHSLPASGASRTGPSVSVPAAMQQGGGTPQMDRGTDAELIRYLVRNPHHLPILRNHGAELLLGKPFYRELWTAVAECAPLFVADDVFSKLADRHKEFWVVTRMNGPTYNTVDEPDRNEQELKEICERLDNISAERQGKTCLTAIRQTSSGDEYDVALLNALQEAVRRKHGKH